MSPKLIQELLTLQRGLARPQIYRTLEALIQKQVDAGFCSAEAITHTDRCLLALSYLMHEDSKGNAFTRMAAQDFNEGPWRDLVDAKLAYHKFIAGARLQYSVRLTPEGEGTVIDNLTQACQVAATSSLFSMAAFLIERMSQGELPLFLSHESDALRKAAIKRLEELAKDSAPK